MFVFSTKHDKQLPVFYIGLNPLGWSASLLMRNEVNSYTRDHSIYLLPLTYCAWISVYPESDGHGFSKCWNHIRERFETEGTAWYLRQSVYYGNDADSELFFSETETRETW